MAFRAVITALLAVLVLPAPAVAAGDWTWPVRGQVLTAFRNGADPYAAGQHRGIDVAAPVGTAVVAAVGGTVRHAGVAGDSGLTVSVRAGEYDVSYLHLSALSVRKGQTVAAGARLGAVGTSGRRSVAAPHLHFGVRRAGQAHAYLDPLDFLAPSPPALPEAPRGAPAPAPVPVVPKPSPAPVRGRAPRRVPAGRPVRLPAGRRVRVPAGRPVRLPRLGPAPRGVAPRALPVPGGGRVPALRPVPSVRTPARPARAPRGGPAPHPPRRAGQGARGRARPGAGTIAPAGGRRAGPGLGARVPGAAGCGRVSREAGAAQRRGRRKAAGRPRRPAAGAGASARGRAPLARRAARAPAPDLRLDRGPTGGTVRGQGSAGLARGYGSSECSEVSCAIRSVPELPLLVVFGCALCVGRCLPGVRRGPDANRAHQRRERVVRQGHHGRAGRAGPDRAPGTAGGRRSAQASGTDTAVGDGARATGPTAPAHRPIGGR